MVDAVGYVPLLVFFAVATPVWAIFTMQDYLLTALKRATVVPVENLVFALLKMGFLAAAVGLSYVFGIAVSWLVATVLIVLAVTEPDAPPHERMSMFVVPADAPGVERVRLPTMLPA